MQSGYIIYLSKKDRVIKIIILKKHVFSSSISGSCLSDHSICTVAKKAVNSSDVSIRLDSRDRHRDAEIPKCV